MICQLRNLLIPVRKFENSLFSQFVFIRGFPLLGASIEKFNSTSFGGRDFFFFSVRNFFRTLILKFPLFELEGFVLACSKHRT